MVANNEHLLDTLLDLPLIQDARVSYDGRWVAWTTYHRDPTAQVYMAPTNGSAPPLRLTNHTDDTTLVGWTRDSRAVIVRADHGGDERARLFRVDLARPEALTPLTEDSPSFFLDGGELHPDGDTLIYGANVDPAGNPIEPMWIYRQSVLTGARTLLAAPARSGAGDPLLSPDGATILYTRCDRHPAGSQLWIADLAGERDEELYSTGDAQKTLGDWLPDGRIIVLAEAATYRRVGLLDVPSGQMRWLLDDPARNIEHLLVPDSMREAAVVLIEQRGARAYATLLNVDTAEEQPLEIAGGNVIPLGPADDGWWVGERYRSDRPTELVRFHWDDPDQDTWMVLTPTADLPRLAPAEDFRWRSVDDLEIQGWLYRATQPVCGTVIYVHGGPTWLAEDRLNAQIQYYVARGLHVLAPNYRGSTGFSLGYEQSIKDDGWGGREQDDIRTGIEALIAAGIAQPGRIAITGTSYGGYSSWCQITRCPPELVAAAAPICGMADLVVDYETTRPDLRVYSEEMMGGSPATIPERYRERSPLHHLGDIRGQLLIIQGLRDPNVTPENVHVAVGELQRVGVEYQLLAFEDEGHGIHRPHNQRVLYQQLADFFEAAFGNR